MQPAVATSVTVRPAHSRRDRKRFLDFPYRHYRDSRFWVPPLRSEQAKAIDPKKNPFFEHGTMELFLASDAKGETVGRIAAIENGMHLKKYDDGNGFFGFFETVEDYAVAERLLDTASAWLRQRGLTGVRGPTNPSMNDTAGLLVDGFDREPSILMPYNPPYYIVFLERYGFTRAMTMWAMYIHEAYANKERLRRGAEIVFRRHPGLTLRTLRPDRFMEDVEAAMHIYNRAWANNWGHVPYTMREAEHLASDLKQIIEPELFFFLEMDNEPVAFSVALPNLNQALRHVKDGRLFPFGLPKLLARAKLGGIYEIRLPLLGVLPEYQGQGFDAPLVNATVQDGIERGYDACDMSWVLDSNKRLINALENLGGVRDKEYVMLEKTL